MPLPASTARAGAIAKNIAAAVALLSPAVLASFQPQKPLKYLREWAGPIRAMNHKAKSLARQPAEGQTLPARRLPIQAR